MNRIVKLSGIAMLVACGMTSAFCAEKTGKNLLKPKWRIYKSGSSKVVIGKDGVIECDNSKWTTKGKDASGVQQTINLNQKTAKPIFISAECKAEKVEGKPSNSFAIYMDIKYIDGTPAWGKGLSFTPGTYDWKKFTATFKPAKPIKSISYLLLLRWRSGKAWFKNPECKEVEVKK